MLPEPINSGLATTIITAIAGVLGGGGFVALLNWRKTAAEAEKADAEAGKVQIGGQLEIVSTTMDFSKLLMAERDKFMSERDKLVDRLDELEATFNKRISRMEKEIEDLERENKALKVRCRALEKERDTIAEKLEEVQEGQDDGHQPRRENTD